MSFFEASKQIDLNVQYIVYEFIRRSQILFPSDNIYYTIPGLVCHWCLLYYFGDGKEKFANYDQAGLKFNKNGDKVANRFRRTGATVYGSLRIPYNSKNAHEWKFKIIKCKLLRWFAVGLQEANCETYDKQFYLSSSSINYAYRANGEIRSCGKSRRASKSKRGDAITMEYNGKYKLLAFKINDDTENWVSAKVQESTHGYKMAAYLGEVGDTIKLLSYKCITLE